MGWFSGSCLLAYAYAYSVNFRGVFHLEAIETKHKTQNSKWCRKLKERKITNDALAILRIKKISIVQFISHQLNFKKILTNVAYLEGWFWALSLFLLYNDILKSIKTFSLMLLAEYLS